MVSDAGLLLTVTFLSVGGDSARADSDLKQEKQESQENAAGTQADPTPDPKEKANTIYAESIRETAEKGGPDSQYRLGWCYLSGIGVEKDPAQAVEWVRKAAEQGFAPAQFELGMSYRYGNGVEKDPAKGAKWLQKAADQGYEEAKEALEKIKAGKK